MVDNRVLKEPQGEPMGYIKGSKLQVTTPVGPDTFSYLFSYGGDAGGALGQQLKQRHFEKRLGAGVWKLGRAIPRT